MRSLVKQEAILTLGTLENRNPYNVIKTGSVCAVLQLMMSDMCMNMRSTVDFQGFLLINHYNSTSQFITVIFSPLRHNTNSFDPWRVFICTIFLQARKAIYKSMTSSQSKVYGLKGSQQRKLYNTYSMGCVRRKQNQKLQTFYALAGLNGRYLWCSIEF